MVPKNQYINPLKTATTEGNLSEQMINGYLSKYYYVCTVTAEEDKLLPKVSMPDNWDEINPFFRYEEAKIDFVSNKALQA